MLGLVCHYVEVQNLKNGKTNLFNKFETKALQLGRHSSGYYSDEYIKSVYTHNLKMTLDVLPEIVKSGIKLFRLSSTLLPLYDVVSRDCWDNEEIKAHLKSIGQFIITNKMRITVHPGQFCVLSSDSDRVVENANKELELHAWLFDAMGLDESPFYAINIHGGKSGRSALLIDRIKSLPGNVRKRLTLENDESAYSVVDLLEVHQQTGTSVVFDSHHHTFNTGELSMTEAFEAACATWPSGVKPLQHISNTEPHLMDGSFTDRRKHSNMIHYVPEPQLSSLKKDEIDVDVEAKLKNLSVFMMSKQFNIPI